MAAARARSDGGAGGGRAARGRARMTATGIADARGMVRQERRAWAFLGTAFLAFLLACGSVGGAGYWYRGHATEKRAARVEVVQGALAYVLPAYQVNWGALPPRGAGPQPPTGGAVELHEGDRLRTLNGTRVLLTLWDGSTLEVFERTELELTELRTTQYINRASMLTIRLQRGLVRVATATGDYSRSRYQVLAADTTVLMKEGEGRTGGGSFLVEVTPGADEGTIVAVRASVRRGLGAVRIAGQADEVRLRANEQTIVRPGEGAGPLTADRRDLVANGRFEGAGVDKDCGAAPAPWRAFCTPGQTEGTFGRLAVVPEQIDGQDVSALEIIRSASSIDSADTGLKQTLDLSVTDLPSLLLTADIKILEQNLPGGGDAGSEFPIIVRINYHDASGAPRNRIWGYSILPGPSGATPLNGTVVVAGQWVPVRIDLRDPALQLVSLESIEVYASGHGYRARVTNVAIIGAEKAPIEK